MKKLLLLFILSLQAILLSQTVYRLFVNKINMPLNNAGVLADVDPYPGGRLDSQVVIFSQGFFLGGYNGNTIWANAVASASRIQDYLPGNVDSSAQDSKYKLYIVNTNDAPFGTSWQAWKEAVKLGAEFYDGNNDGIYNPVDLDSNGIFNHPEDAPPIPWWCQEIVWCVFNDAVPPAIRRFNNVNPQGIEIRQLVMAFKNEYSIQPLEVLDYSIIVKYQIVNSGKVSTLLDSVYFGLWADTDIGDPTDEYAGSDTLVQSGYVYNDSSDAEFGLTPPAHFMTLLQGPIVFLPGQTFTDNNSNNTYEEGIDNPLDSAFQQNFTERKMVRGAKNLGISSFIHYQSSDPFIGDPNTNLEAYNYLRGRIRTGEFINPCNWNLGKVVGDNCLEVNPVFYYSGDPVTDWGWINIKKNDQRQLTSVGPFKLEADKPVDIIVGSIIAKGSSNLNSISLGKEYASNLIRVAKSNLNILITGSANDYKTNPSEFLLSQNYPNPFNPSTKINYSLPYTANVKLQVYDVLGNLITTIVNEEQNAGSYNVDLDLSKFSSGVYFYQLQTGNFIQTKKMLLMK